MSPLEAMVAALRASGATMAEIGQAVRGFSTAPAPEPPAKKPSKRDWKIYQLTGPYRRWKRDSKYRETYWANTHGHLKLILKFLGKDSVHDITPGRVDEFQQWLATQPTYKGTLPEPGTINLTCNTLYALISWYYVGAKLPKKHAHMKLDVRQHPMKGWVSLKVPKKRNWHVPPKDIELFLTYANVILRQMVTLSCELGFRKGEVLRLEWTEVDLEQGRINLSEDKVKDDEDRSIPLSRVAYETLKLVRRDIPSRWVFPNPRTNGETPYPETTVWQWFQVALKKSGITGPERCGKRQKVWFHSFRHSMATFMMQRGMPAELLRELGGWSDEKVAKLYKETSPEYLAQATKYMDANPMADRVLALLKGERLDAKPALTVVKSKPGKSANE
jgi:integrase